MNQQAQQLQDHRYLNLETFKPSGQAARTPMWFVQDGTALYVRTGAASGKVRRVRVAPSDATGTALGPWAEGTARLVAGDEADHANLLAKRKYGAFKLAFDLLNCLQRRTRATIRIDLPLEPIR